MHVTDNDLFFAKVKENAKIPKKDSENAGYDIWACFDEDYRVIEPHHTELIPTGIASAMNSKWYLQVEERGSTGSKGIKKSAGVIDSGYRGEIFIAVSNVNDRPLIISKLSTTELYEKHGNELSKIVWEASRDKEKAPIIYPYEKAIAQLILHEVPCVDVNEISYEDLLNISSARGTGALGSSGN